MPAPSSASPPHSNSNKNNPPRRPHPTDKDSGSISRQIFGTRHEQATRMVVMGYTAREISEALSIELADGQKYVAKYGHIKYARREDDVQIVKGMMIAAFEDARGWLKKAEEATETIIVAGQPHEVARPNFDAASAMLERMDGILDKLGEGARFIGPTAVADINASARAKEKEREQEFQRDRPDLIPGLGYSPSTSPSRIGLVFEMPKTPEVIEAQRVRDERKALPAPSVNPPTDPEPCDPE